MYANLKGAKVFSTIDLRSRYHHIALGKSSRAKTAFVMPFGKYEFLMVPFGLAQAPAKGSSNILADTLSRLIAINSDTPLTPEGQGYEFGYAIFEEFPEVKTNTYEVNEVIVGTKKEIRNDPDLQDTLQCIENPITPQRLKRLQQQDANIETLKCKLQHNKLDKEYYSMDSQECMQPSKEFSTGKA